MPVYFLPGLGAALAALAIWTRESGIYVLGARIDLWRWLIVTEPQSAPALLMENLILWAVMYGSAHALLYTEPGRSIVKPIKFNQAYPARALVMREAARCIRGVLIATLYEAVFNRAHATGALPLVTPGVLRVQPSHEPDGLLAIAAGVALVMAVADAHFYWTHRALHALPWLYRNVHKLHHESHNPDPFSGLSMHWIEHAIYFSADVLCALIAPVWLARISTKAHIVFPLSGHCGVGSWRVEASCNHYIHHTKFEWNYGASPMWDRLMHTNYPPAWAAKEHAARSVADGAAGRDDDVRRAPYPVGLHAD